MPTDCYANYKTAKLAEDADHIARMDEIGDIEDPGERKTARDAEYVRHIAAVQALWEAYHNCVINGGDA